MSIKSRLGDLWEYVGDRADAAWRWYRREPLRFRVALAVAVVSTAALLLAWAAR
jgi:hypothetical protein